MEKRRVYDYSTFSSNKNKNLNFNTDMNFTVEISSIDVDIFNKPKELEDIKNIECEIDYSVRVQSNKTGISTIDFLVTSIELEIVSDNNEEDIDYEIDILPGKNTDIENIVSVKADILIPSEPTKIEIDMGKSMDPKDFRIQVIFGHDK